LTGTANGFRRSGRSRPPRGRDGRRRWRPGGGRV